MAILIEAVSVYCDNCDAKAEIDTNILLDTKKQNVTHLLNIQSPVETWCLDAIKQYGYEYETLCEPCVDKFILKEET